MPNDLDPEDDRPDPEESDQSKAKRVNDAWQQLDQEHRDDVTQTIIDRVSEATNKSRWIPALATLYIIGYPLEDRFVIHSTANVNPHIAAVTIANYMATLYDEEEETMAAFMSEMIDTVGSEPIEELITVAQTLLEDRDD